MIMKSKEEIKEKISQLNEIINGACKESVRYEASIYLKALDWILEEWKNGS